MWINDTGDGEGGVQLGFVQAGSTFHIIATTTNLMTTGVVPGLQEWQSNQTDNAKFTFVPDSDRRLPPGQLPDTGTSR